MRSTRTADRGRARPVDDRVEHPDPGGVIGNDDPPENTVSSFELEFGVNGGSYGAEALDGHAGTQANGFSIFIELPAGNQRRMQEAQLADVANNIQESFHDDA